MCWASSVVWPGVVSWQIRAASVLGHERLLTDINQVLTSTDHSFPWAVEFSAELWNSLFCRGNKPSRRIYAFPQNLSNFWKYTPKPMFFSSLVPTTRQKSNQYFISQVFVHASWPLSMPSVVMCNILFVVSHYTNEVWWPVWHLNIHCESKKLHHFIFAVTSSNQGLFGNLWHTCTPMNL